MSLSGDHRLGAASCMAILSGLELIDWTEIIKRSLAIPRLARYEKFPSALRLVLSENARTGPKVQAIWRSAGGPRKRTICM